MAENINITLQKLANSSAKAIQDSVNKANLQGLQFNAKEAATARQWQEKMSKSAHQMEVADLKKAGLNPVLSANSGGAQSYTTSAASGSVDSGANAYGSVMSGLMSTLSGLKQSEMSAAAQRYSADRSYHAAELSAMAQKYAAEQSAAAQRYAADMSYKTQMDKPQNSVVSIFDKYLGNRYGKKTIKGIEDIVKKNWDYKEFKNGNNSLTVKTVGSEDKPIDLILNKLGYSQYYINNLSPKLRNQLRDRAYQAFVYRNPKYLKSFGAK